MISYAVYNQKGEKVGTESLKESFFGLKKNEGLIHQAAVAQYANSRRVIAHTKTRGEVRGGGKKPWRQKGTGRARHGSIRSPLWRGGGIVFGPRTGRNYAIKINKKMKRKALLMCLSARVAEENFILMDSLHLDGMKTRKLVEILRSLPCKDRKTLIVLPESDKNIFNAGKNIQKVKTITVNSINILDVLEHPYIVFPKAGIKKIQELFSLRKSKTVPASI